MRATLSFCCLIALFVCIAAANSDFPQFPIKDYCYSRSIHLQQYSPSATLCLFFPFDIGISLEKLSLTFGKGVYCVLTRSGTYSAWVHDTDRMRFDAVFVDDAGWLDKIRNDTHEVLFGQPTGQSSLLVIVGSDINLISASYVAMGEFGVPFVDKMRILLRLIVWYASS